MPSKSIFDPAEALKRYNKDIDWRKIMKGPEIDDEEDMRKDHYRQNLK